MCLCGATFKNKVLSDLHEKFNEHLNQDYIRHAIMKFKWQSRLWNLFYEYPWKITFRLMGLWIIWFILMKHCNIHLNIKESICIGIAMGLLV